MTNCSDCGATVPPQMLACPNCRRLVHADELKQIAQAAEQLESTGDRGGALMQWRQALTLLPPEARQHQVIGERIARLSAQVAEAPPTPPPPNWTKRLGPFGVVAIFLWKFKFLVIAFLSKGKLLLLGLTKVSTLFSMLLSMAAYWALFGWRFGVGLVVSIYVHEMGHVAAMRAFGLPATAPMFIPGFGAFIRLKARPTSAIEDARIGLAGPVWGLGAALIAFVVGRGSGWPAWLAIAHAGAFINVFNLLPVWQLDGGRAFSALGRLGRMLVAGAFLLAWLYSKDGLCLLLALASLVRAFGKEAPPASDRVTLLEFVGLIAVLGWLVAQH